MMNRQKKLAKLSKLLYQSAALADELDFRLGNGGEMGSVIGGCASEVDAAISSERPAELDGVDNKFYRKSDWVAK